VNEEFSLLARARKLDPDALAAIHDTFYTPIYQYMLYRVSDSATAEDLTSEVFTRFLSVLRDRHSQPNTIKGWLFGVANKVVNDFYRKKYRAPHIALHESMPGMEDTPGTVFDNAHTRAALRSALTDLTEEQQMVLGLRFGSDMPIRDVAELMGKTEGAVKQLQARAIAALSRKLTGVSG
jgi:RNA polymerase sigma-70 factor, ECF subfamily